VCVGGRFLLFFFILLHFIFLSLWGGLLGFVSLPLTFFLLVPDVRLFSFSSALQLCVFSV
jgi:hypothetical protein